MPVVNCKLSEKPYLAKPNAGWGTRNDLSN